MPMFIQAQFLPSITYLLSSALDLEHELSLNLHQVGRLSFLLSDLSEGVQLLGIREFFRGSLQSGSC